MGKSIVRTSWSLGLVLLGCTVPTTEGSVGVATQALDACGEMVPADRYIDGIPAYKQCAAVQNGAVYSNNGVDTSTTAMGPDWVRTQWSGGYQCTELAGRYLQFKWDVSWRPNGNAGEWCNAAPPANSGLVQTMAPVHGDLMVLAPSSCGADPSAGHVTVVDIVDPSGRLTVLEQNGARRGTYMQSCAKCFLHVVKNDGTNPGNTITGGAAQPGAAGAAAPSSAAGAPAPAPSAGSAGAMAPRPGRSTGGSWAPPPAPGAAPAAAGAAAPAITPMPAAAPAAPPMLATLPAKTSQPGAAMSANAEPEVRMSPAEAGGCSVAARSARPAWSTLAALSCVLLTLLGRRRSRRRLAQPVA